MIERKAGLANPKHQYHVSQRKGHDYGANNKKNEDYYRYPSFLIPWINFNYKENDGKKCFSSKSNASISCILWEEHDCSTHNKKNGDYYRDPRWSLSMNEH